MDPILADIYSTIIPSAPYIIAAYALLWCALLIFILVIVHNTRKNTKQISLLEEEVNDLKSARAKGSGEVGAEASKPDAAKEA
jgi:hypothetical protein